MLIANEFAAVDVDLDTKGKGPRLRIEDKSTGVHVFLDETRSYYDLDRLWADVPHLDVPHLDVPHLDVLVPEPQTAT